MTRTGLQRIRAWTQVGFFSLFLLAPPLDILRIDLTQGHAILLGQAWTLGIDDFLAGRSGIGDATLNLFLRGFLPLFGGAALFIWIAWRYGRLYCGWLCPHFSVVELINGLMRRASGSPSLWERPKKGSGPKKGSEPFFRNQARGHNESQQKKGSDPFLGDANAWYWVPTLLAVAGFAFLWALAFLTYLLPPFEIYHNLLHGTLTRNQGVFLAAATLALSVEFLLARHFFCRYACAVGLFQSLAWMANDRAMVVGFDTRRDQVRDEPGALVRKQRAVDQQALRRAADAGAPRLGIEDDLTRFFDVGGLVDIDVHDAFKMGENRHTGLGLHAGDETFAATRDDHVDHAAHAQHLADCGPVGRRDHLDRVLGQPGRAQSLKHRRVDGPGAVETLGTAAQNHRVAGFEAERAGIRRHVRSALVNDADDADRRPHAADFETRWPVPLGHDGADRIRLAGDGTDPLGHAPDPVGGQEKPVEHRGAQTFLTAGYHVARVRLKDDVARGLDRVRRGPERRVLGFRLRLGQNQRGVLCPQPDRAHQLLHVRSRVHPVRPYIVMSSRCTSEARPAWPSSSAIRSDRWPMMIRASASS